MNKLPWFIWSIAFLILASGCESKLENTEFKTVRVKGKYDIQIPQSMTRTRDLNDEADLQYQNVFTNMYTIVLDEAIGPAAQNIKLEDYYNDTAGFAQNYLSFQLEYVEADLTGVTTNIYPTTKIHGLPAVSASVTGFFSDADEDLTYYLTVIEGRKNVFLVMSWTLGSSKEAHVPIFKKIAESFRLLKKKRRPK